MRKTPSLDSLSQSDDPVSEFTSASDDDTPELASTSRAPLLYRRSQDRATVRTAEEERLRHAVGGGLVASMKAGPRLEPPRSRRRAYVLCELTVKGWS